MKKIHQSLMLASLLLLAVVTLSLAVATFSCESQPHSYSNAMLVLKASGEVTISKDGDKHIVHYNGSTEREVIKCLLKLSESYVVTVNNN